MHFHIEADFGDRITGWLIPDSPAREPRIIVQTGDHRVIVPATIIHPDMVAAGMHSTGKCGFIVGEAAVPNMSQTRDLKLIDEDTGITIFARPQLRPYIQQRLFAFDQRAGENSICAAAMADAFYMIFPDIHRFGQDTRKSCISVYFSTSTFINGSPCFRAEEPFLREQKFRCVALLPEPAELLFDQLMPANEAARPDAVGRFAAAVARLDVQTAAAVSDGLTRRLCLLQLDDRLPQDCIAQGLETLAGFDAIGVEAATDQFLDLAGALFDADTQLFKRPAVRLPRPGLSVALRQEPAIRKLIERDIEIYDSVADAIVHAQDDR